ncbi:hypothetical protein KI387_041003, partial [Taxus chinensis]
YIPDPSHVLDWTTLHVHKQGKVMVEPVHIIERMTLGLRGREIDQVRIQWDRYDETSATWEDATLLR